MATEPTHRLWAESWYGDFAAPDGSLGGYAQLTLWPNLGRSWFWSALVGADRQPVYLVETDAPLPRPSTLELRAPGLWTEFIEQIPDEHFTVDLEAFAVALDDPEEVFGLGWGDRVPYGLELEWEAEAGSLDVVHGQVLVGDEVIELDGRGRRFHWEGLSAWWDREWSNGPADATIVASTPLPVDHPDTAQRARLERSLVATPSGPAWTEQNHPAPQP
ncbi:MAG: hypothetical protein F4Y28_05175 [Acidimicrobiia bacterium]|nr:hypothetical protein [Acidimicrobiia bacterium]MYG58285.1 hypothetical protein [Acidimicrobiia bacterium]MYJ34053.1 hypothetical protein [Acidimicrobiia bacterium]